MPWPLRRQEGGRCMNRERSTGVGRTGSAVSALAEIFQRRAHELTLWDEETRRRVPVPASEAHPAAIERRHFKSKDVPPLVEVEFHIAAATRTLFEPSRSKLLKARAHRCNGSRLVFRQDDSEIGHDAPALYVDVEEH